MKELKQVIGVLLVYTILALPLSLFSINTELVVCAPDISLNVPWALNWPPLNIQHLSHPQLRYEGSNFINNIAAKC